MKRPVVAIYAREGIKLYKGNTIDQQVKTCKKRAASDLGFREEQIEFLEYRDIGSGNNSNRKGLQQLLCDIKQKNIDYLYVYKLDKIGRYFADLLIILDELEKCNTSFVSVMDGLSSKNPTSKIIVKILAVIAEIERDNLGTAV